MTVRRTARALAFTGASATAVLLLAGCTPSPAPAPTVTVTVTPTAAPAPSPTATSDDTSLSGTAFNFDCSALDALGTATAVDANYVTAPEYSPAPDSDAANISAINGVDCAWVTPDSTLVIGIALPNAAARTYYEQTVAQTGEATTSFGANSVPGYFAVTDGVGEADVFTDGGYWVSISAPQFASPADVAPTLAAVLQTLPAG